MKSSLLSTVASTAGRAGIAGFGASAGRDLWKSTKKSSGTILLLAAVAAAVSLPFLGARNLFRGHGPGEWWKGIGDVLLITIGLGIGIGISLLVATMMGEEPFALTLIGIVSASSLAACTGILVGMVQRPAAQRRHAIARANETFLQAEGITETGENEITHRDRHGTPLRLQESTPRSIVFMVVGARNKRAYLRLGPEGEIIEYTGVVPLSAVRT